MTVYIIIIIANLLVGGMIGLTGIAGFLLPMLYSGFLGMPAAQGLALSDFTAKPARLEILASGREGSTARVTLTEGKFHQVKRMFAAVGHPLRSLSRERIGCVRLDPALEAGQYRALKADEIAGLKAQVGL